MKELVPSGRWGWGQGVTLPRGGAEGEGSRQDGQPAQS